MVMRFETGWDTELKTIYAARDLRDKYRADGLSFRFDDHAAIGAAWERIRQAQPITHPEAPEAFSSPEEAAAILTHYWIGDVDEADLLRRAFNGKPGSPLLLAIAQGNALRLTAPGSTERENVLRATHYLDL